MRDNLLIACTRETQVVISQDQALLQQASVDFGHLTESHCTAIAQPKTPQEVALLIPFANQHGLFLTPRGFGLSQSGQTLPPEGAITLDLSALQQVIEIQPESLTVRCQANISWRQLIEKLQPYGLVPKVIPLNPDLTVAGTISIGGIGATSHRFGAIINNVTALQVITGAGETIQCSAEKAPEVFYATLAGLGRFSIITEVTLALRKLQPRVRTYFLLYTDHEQWLQDQQDLMKSLRGDYIEAYCSASIQGLRQTANGRKPFAHWFYCLQVSFEYHDKPPEEAEALQGLHYWKQVHREDLDIMDYINRYAPRFALMRKTGAWDMAHPWLECLLPVNSLSALLPQLLEQLPLSLGDGHRVLFVARQKDNNSFFMQSQSNEDAVLFAVLPTGIANAMLPEALAALQQVHELLIAAGGKRYLSGWLGMMDQQDWQRHYGDKYARWLAAKKKYDPQGILRSVLFP